MIIMTFVSDVSLARRKMDGVVKTTELLFSDYYSTKYNSNIYIKREDQQVVRSFKIRGAFNKINNLTSLQREKGVVCASAGNHAQGFGYTCQKLGIIGHIFLPETTPKQKIDRIKYFSKEFCTLHVYGSNFAQTLRRAQEFCETNNMVFVHPYDDFETIIGQATIGLEILGDLPNVDYIICPVGGGGLISGIGKYAKNINPNVKIIGVEPLQCPSMKRAIEEHSRPVIDCSDSFVDGATVNQAGEHTLEICKDVVDEIILVSNGRLCCEIVDLYQIEGLITEPAGALSLACLDQLDIKNKNVVCLLSGSNNDLMRYPDIVNKAQIYKNLRHYIIVKFIQKAGQLKDFLTNILGPTDDIIKFEYIKKTNNNFGNVLVGLEVMTPSDVELIYSKMEEKGFQFTKINDNDQLFEFLV